MRRLCEATLFLLLSVAGCAAWSGGESSSHGDLAGELPAKETDLTDGALVASGFESPASLRSARARFESLVSPIVEHLRRVADPRERAQQLLGLLHQKGGLLGEYDARATTLAEILDRRRYNCVSASVVYNILAERLALEVEAQLLPTHARTILAIPGEKRLIIIETTSPEGFNPDARMQASILAQVGGLGVEGRSLVPEAGSIVSTRVLIGAIYVNRASIVQENGDLEAAERLFGRGERLAESSAMLHVLRDQRAALLSQLAANDLLANDPSRIDRALRTLRAAIELDPKKPEIRRAVLQNLRAAAERKIHHLAEGRDGTPLLDLANTVALLGLEPEDRSGVKAFALSEIARVRLESNDFEGALQVLERAVKEPLAPRDGPLKLAIQQNHVSALRLLAFALASKGELEQSLALIERIRVVPGLSAKDRGDTNGDVLRVLQLVGNKRIDDGDLVGAREIYREGLRHFPRDPTCTNNLVAVLERLALPLVTRGECDKVAAYGAEIRQLDPGSRFPVDARVRCLLERGAERLDVNDFSGAVSLIRAAREVNPEEPVIRSHLAVALLKWTRALASSGSCARAVSIAQELRSLSLSNIHDGDIRRALGACRD